MAFRRPPEPAWYRNAPLVLGLGLVALGLGNWITGAVRLRQIAENPRSGIAAEEAADDEASRTADAEITRVKGDFYRVVATGGRLLTAVGIGLAAFGLARGGRGEARRG